MLSTWEVFVAAGSPILKVIAIALTGAFCATDYASVLTQEVFVHVCVFECVCVCV